MNLNTVSANYKYYETFWEKNTKMNRNKLLKFDAMFVLRESYKSPKFKMG